MTTDITKQVQMIRKDLVMEFGDRSDGAIEFVGIVEGGYIETGYFYGDAKPKNIIVASTQVGCPSRCNFCELGNQSFTRNLSAQEIHDQIILILQQAAAYGHVIETVIHKINWAKSGDPLFNPEFVHALELLVGFGYSHKVSTVFPAGKKPGAQFRQIADFASSYPAPVQIQVSLISTSEAYRKHAAGIATASFQEITQAAEYWRAANPQGRKINLSLILDEHNPIDVARVVHHFSPDLFRFRFRNYVPTENGSQHGLEAITRQRFDKIYRTFQDKGYEVGTWATPTLIEQRFGLASNVTLRRYRQMVGEDAGKKF